MGRRRPRPHQPLPAAERHDQDRRLRGCRLGPEDAEQYTKAYFDNFGAPQQFPYLRIPGTFEYWTALDIHLSEAATGQKTPEEALKATVDDFESITDRLGRDQQKDIYKQVARHSVASLAGIWAVC